MNRLIKFVASSVAGFVALTGFNATTAFAATGGDTGALFITESESGTVWLGSVDSTPKERTEFWQEDGATPDQVAVTDTHVAWTRNGFYSGSDVNQVLIAKIAPTAKNIVTVDFGSEVVQSLAGDVEGNIVWANTSAGKLYKISENGTKTVVHTDSDLEIVVWSLDYDPSAKRIYAGASVNDEEFFEDSKLFYYDLNNALDSVTGETTLFTGAEAFGVNGIEVDNTQPQIFWTSWADNGYLRKSLLNNFNAIETVENIGIAPTGMVVNWDQGRILFTVENAVLEYMMNLTSLTRTLYEGEFDSNGYQGMAIAFGVEVTEAPERGNLSKKKAVYFNPDSPVLTKKAKSTLRKLANSLPEYATDITVNLKGWVNPIGKVSAGDKALSKARAKNVRAFLKNLLPDATFTSKGAGRAKEKGQKARRVNITVYYNNNPA